MSTKSVRYFLSVLLGCLLVVAVMGATHMTGIAAAKVDNAVISPAPLSQSLATSSLALSSAISATGIPFTVIDHDPVSGYGIGLNSYGNHIVRDSAGNLYVAYTLFTDRDYQRTPWFLYTRSSSDNGVTWSAPVRPDSYPNSIVGSNLQVDSLGRLHLGFIFNVYAYYTRSDDHGVTWNPATPLRGFDASYYPSLAIDGAGSMTAAYIEFGNFNSPPPWPIAVRQSTNGGDTWGGAVNLPVPPIPNQDKCNAVNLVAGKNGWQFLTYFDYTSSTVHSQFLQFFDGTTWSTPIALSDPDVDSYYADLAVDSTGLLHIVYGRGDPDSGVRGLYYRTFDPAGRTLSSARRLTSDDESVLNVTLGVYQGDVVVTAYDLYSEPGGIVTFGGVYVRSSADDFASRQRISTHPNARNPNLRSSTFHFNYPSQEDILWVEPNAQGGEDLVYGQLPRRLSMMIEPAVGGAITDASGQGFTTTIQIPAGAVTTTTQLLYTSVPAVSTTPAPDFSFAGDAFSLQAYQGGSPAELTFTNPVTVVIGYADEGIGALNESTLMLYYWDGTQWATDGIEMRARDAAHNQLEVSLYHLSEFALFGQSSRQYLPLVVR